MKKKSNKTWWLIAIAVLTAATVTGSVMRSLSLRTANTYTPAASAMEQRQSLEKMPLLFIENQGQWDNTIAYLARMQGMTAWLHEDGITFDFKKHKTPYRAQGVVLRMTFENASEWVSLSGTDKRSSRHNFFVGSDPTAWQRNVDAYDRVVYHGLYTGIDLCLREENGWLEYDLLLSEGADLSDVIIRCEGLQGLMIDDDGFLVMETAYGSITQQPPVAWYESWTGERIPVTCNFRVIDDEHYGFDVEDDLGLALVIDPALEWSTFLSGSGHDHCLALDLTAAGHVIVVGATESTDFPATSGAYDTTFTAGDYDGFVSCLSADGSQLLWSTAIGGNGVDLLFNVAIDNAGRIIVTGSTSSNDFPTTAGAYDMTYNGDWDGLIACFSESGSELLYSSFLGTAAPDMSVALDVSNAGDAVICGYTWSEDFPTTSGAYDTTYNGGVRDAFVTRLNTDGSSLVFSTYLGGYGDDGTAYSVPIVENTALMNVLFDDEENVIVSGVTTSPDFPTTPDAYDTTYNGDYDYDIFVAKLNEAGSGLIFSTYLGGSNDDAVLHNSMSLYEDGMIAVGGATWSHDFPTTYNAFDTTHNGGTGDGDAIVVVLDSTASQLLYSTFIGGTGPYAGDVVSALAFDGEGDLLLAGQAESGFPVTPGAYDTTMGGRYDAFVARLSPDSCGEADLVYSSYIGGADSTEGTCDLSLIDDSTVVIAGWTLSGDFPTTALAYDTVYKGYWDGFILRFGAYVGIQEQNMSQPQSLFSLSPVYPNPVHDRLSYGIHLAHATQVTVRLFDVAGRLVATLIDRPLPAGDHNFAWKSPHDLAQGTYYLRIDTENDQLSQKFVLLK